MLKPILRSGNVIRNFKFEGNPPDKVCLLFGWAAGELKYVSKYATIWKELGIGQCVVMTTPLGFRGRKSEKEIRSVVSNFLEHVEGDLSKSTIYMHSFSNGGMVFSSRCIDMLEKKNIPIEAVIFDSAPSLEDSARVPANVFSESIPKEFKLARTLIFYLVFSVLSTLSFLGRIFGINGHAQVLKYFGVRFLKQHLSLHKKVLFLYSQNDPITSAKLLEDWTAKSLPIATLYDFNDSPHVAHYRKYPDVYKSKIKELI
jgi:hypothetical protein